MRLHWPSCTFGATHHPRDHVRATPYPYGNASRRQAPGGARRADVPRHILRDNSNDDIEAYVRDSFALDRVCAELSDDANTFLLAFTNGDEQPGGYAKLRTGTTAPGVTGDDPVELQRLYVDRTAIAHGVGAALMRGKP